MQTTGEQVANIAAWSKSVKQGKPPQDIPEPPPSVVGSSSGGTVLSSVAPSESASQTASEPQAIRGRTTFRETPICPMRHPHGVNSTSGLLGTPNTNPDKTIEPRTPRYTRGSPSFQTSRVNTAREIQVVPIPHLGSSRSNVRSTTSRSGAASSNGSASTTQVNITIDPPRDNDNSHGTGKPTGKNASGRDRQTNSVSVYCNLILDIGSKHILFR